MNIIINERLIKRNRRIGLAATLAGLVVLGVGMYISFRQPDYFLYSLLALLVGFLLSQVGIYFSNRWGRSPRPDEMLSQSLKGLDKKFTLYHYTSPVSHLLVGPSGLWILQPRIQKGEISYSKGRWRQKGGNLYMKIFAQEGLGRPDLDIAAETRAMEKYLSDVMPEEELPSPEAALVFLHPDANINISEDETPPAETFHASKLKDFIRKSSKNKTLTTDQIDKINAVLQEE